MWTRQVIKVQSWIVAVCWWATWDYYCAGAFVHHSSKRLSHRYIRTIDTTTNSNTRIHTPLVVLTMGLYDTPLPPRDDTNDQEDDSLLLRNVVPLFDVQPDGTDANGFLPPLDTADCTTPPNSEKSNKNVQLLVEKTKCRDDDAAWALQACQGDLVRAWEYISMAERALRKEQTKRQSRQTNNDDEEDENWDEDLFSMMGKIEEEKESAEPSLEEQRKPMSLEDLLDGSEPDQRWLPGKPNPNPVDDEPWFTG